MKGSQRLAWRSLVHRRSAFVPKGLLLILLTLSHGAGAFSPQEHRQLLIAGDYHGDEAPIKPGIGWLALIPAGGVWRLEPTQVRAKPVFDPVMDTEGQETGIRITSNRADSIALLRFPEIRPGKIDTPNMTFKDKPRPVVSGDEPLRITFKGVRYLIEVDADRVYLRTGKIKTLLPNVLAAHGDSENTARLLWAGDLDGDGRLDLLFAYGGSNHYGTCLFLSAGAGAGKLIRQAACHGGIGC